MGCKKDINRHRDLIPHFEAPTFLDQYHGVAIACSGGVDSMALAHFFFANSSKFGQKKIQVLHANYGLRGQDSDLDQKCVEDFCDLNQIPFDILTTHRPPQTGIQAWARQQRRSWFQQFADHGWLITLAHHQDDIAENVLLRMCRGSSPGHLAGLRVHSSPYWRPLLSVNKAQIRAYANSFQIPFREDQSNFKNNYSRNTIRNQIIPQLENIYPHASQRIARAATQAQQIADWIRKPYQNRTSIQADEIKGLPIAVADEIIQAIVGGKQQWLSESILSKIQQNLRNNINSCWTRPDGVRILIKDHKLWTAEATAKEI